MCVIRRIDSRVRSKIIPESQAAYSKGRSTTELVFAFKLLDEKTIATTNYEINFLVLAMSTTFDTIQKVHLFDAYNSKRIFIQCFKEMLETDE